MKVFNGNSIRNVGIGGHSGSGKTSLAEAFMYRMGEITRLGKIEEGNTVSDFSDDEIDRQVSISASLLSAVWNDTKINFIDVPGFSDFYGEALSGLRPADAIMINVSAANGVEVGTERIRALCDRFGIPRFYVINKVDRENVQFDNIYNELKDRFGKKLTLIHVPNTSGPGFNTITDILAQKVYTFPGDGSGKATVTDADAAAIADQRNELMEAVAESDDDLLEKYFEAGELTEEELQNGFRDAVRNKMIIPVLCASATTNVGPEAILDFIENYISPPTATPTAKMEDDSEVERNDSSPLTAFVFKTASEAHMGELAYVRVVSGILKSGEEVSNPTRSSSERIGQIYVLRGKNRTNVDQLHAGDIGALVKLKSTKTNDTLCQKGKDMELPKIDFPVPLVSVAVSPQTKGDEDKLGTGLNKLHEEDPTFTVRYDGEIKQTIVGGQGELHMNINFKRLKDRFGVDVETEEPKIPYRETIKGKAEAQGKFKKQTGGRGQYGDAHLRIEPQPRGEGFEFVDEVVGGVIPGKFIPAVEKGAIETCEKGIVAGYPVVDIKVTVFYGSYHNVDSSENAFKVASSMALKQAFKGAKPVLLEPIYKLEVKVPDDYMGDVMGDISGRRGKIQGTEPDGRFQTVKAQVPLAELYNYSTTLRSMTQGQGIFHREFDHYDEVPGDVAKKIIAAYESGEED